MGDFPVFRITKGTDEMLFGEIVHMTVKQGYPMISLKSDEDYHRGSFLMQGTDLFIMHISIKRYTRDFVLSALTDVPIRIDLRGMAIVRGATFNHLLEMYKTNVSNIFKFPLLGQIKVHHDYNRIYVWASIVGRGSKYFREYDKVDREYLSSDLTKAFDEMMKALYMYINPEGDLKFVDQGFDLEKELNDAEARIVQNIRDPSIIPVKCPQCGDVFDAPTSGTVKCPACGAAGEIGD